jgi:1,2-phenylacetyl-CoA epoxidase catalytic subunit
MAKTDIDSYRFLSGEEPTDEQLAQIMKEVTEEVKATHERVTREYFAQMARNTEIKKKKWAERINQLKYECAR